jgi:integrase
MAKVNQRLWKLPGQRTKRKAWGFTAQINGKQVRRYKAEWTQDDAEAELAKALLDIQPAEAEPKRPGITLEKAAERYLATRTNRGNARSRDEKRTLEHLKAALGADTPLEEITAASISEYKAGRLGATSLRTGRPLTAAAVNRPLAVLRHLLQLAVEEWEVLDRVPRIKLEREPEGRIVWLEPDEEARLLEACRASRTKHLASLVTVALESGLRRSELLGLTWDRVDFSRGVLRLEKTKSGKRREVPMRQAVYEVLAALPGRREGRVWPAADVRTAFENAVEAARLDRLEEPFTLHGCRHHFASWFVMRGGSLPALQRLLGHATLAMTMRYAHLAPEHLRTEIARTERPRSVETASVSAQGSAQEPVREDASEVPTA